MRRNSVALRRADPNNCLLLKLILYNCFEIITRFNRLINQRTRFKSQFHAIASLYEDFSNSQLARAHWVKTTARKNVIWSDVNVRLYGVGHSMTKISRIDELPNFHGALRAELRYDLCTLQHNSGLYSRPL